ncbi:Uncharacterised protein [uncultured archaeon]|nr:Uncharacterised protein [uncultured archaeon]
MRSINLLTVSLIFALLSLAVVANAQYWFQSGARAGSASSQNNGASVSIQTVTPQNVRSGAVAFWVGENLQNGAFLQAGYLIENQTGNYPTNCTAAGCSSHQYVTAGNAEWFYEYFLPGRNDSFMGAIGPDGSAGVNGTFNTYSFFSQGNVWYFLFNNKTVGSADLGMSSSGYNWPVALGELANASNNKEYIKPVIFSNLSTYSHGAFLPVSSGYGAVGYGVGSRTDMTNPYGVKEIGSRTNYFAVGSGIPTTANNTRLWTLGYTLTIASKYGGLGGKTGYTAYSTVGISAPTQLYLDNFTRVNFIGWTGAGFGSYTGYRNNASVVLDSNINETANWQLQYRVNVSSQFSSPVGSGWYNNASLARYGISESEIKVRDGERYVFTSWNNGNKNLSGSVKVTASSDLVAGWQHQYFINVSSPYDNVTGSGWYASNSTANLSVGNPVMGVGSGERIAFVSWSNGDVNATLHAKVTAPLRLNASFERQYAIDFVAVDAYGRKIAVPAFTLGGIQVNSSSFLAANRTYAVNGAYYKGVFLPSNASITASSTSSFTISLPVYNVSVRTVDLFDLPVNVSVLLTYKNDSSASAFSGGGGLLQVSDVPLGYSNVSASYLGITGKTSTVAGAPATLVFVSLTNIAAMAFAAVAAAALLTFRAIRRIRKF